VPPRYCRRHFSIGGSRAQEEEWPDGSKADAVENLPPKLQRKREEVERALGKRVLVRGIRTPDEGLRGRLRSARGRMLIEYQVAEEGYFWHIPVIEELLNRAAAGEIAVELREPAGDRRDGRQER
jgi:hypothetical protein